MIQPWCFEACSPSAFFTYMHTPLSHGNDGRRFSQVAVWVQFSRLCKMQPLDILVRALITRWPASPQDLGAESMSILCGGGNIPG